MPEAENETAALGVGAQDGGEKATWRTSHGDLTARLLQRQALEVRRRFGLPVSTSSVVAELHFGCCR